jgi:hypothetical protein
MKRAAKLSHLSPMYKILCYLLTLMLSGTNGAFGQKPPVDPARLDNPVEQKPLRDPGRDVFTNRKTAFTAHLLAGKVDPGKKYACDVLVMDRTASLLYPNPYQTQPLYPWPTVRLTFRSGAES